MNQATQTTDMPEWAQTLLKALDLNEAGKPEEVLDRAGKVADRLAPNTRWMFKWILAFQGGAVLMPLLWFLVRPLQLPVSYTAYSVALCTLLAVVIIWWLRWRGMQQTWIRARAISNIARSAIATRGISDQATVTALADAPGLQSIARWIVGEGNTKQLSLGEEKKRYVAERIDDQLEYYRTKYDEAVKQRHRLSQGVTLALDAALFLAVAGVAISVNPQAASWLKWSGSDYWLGAVGAALPLLAILLQLRGSYLDLNRRAGRYPQQIEFLDFARTTAVSQGTDESFDANVLEIERCLLGEVVEWFYQGEHSEPYYHAKTPEVQKKHIQKLLTKGRTAVLWKIFAGIGVSAVFFLRVFFGRILVAGLAIVVTTALIAFRGADTDSSAQSDLRGIDGRLLSSFEGTTWHPDPSRARNGFILIAHGLHDGVKEFNGKGEPHWMRRMQEEMRKELGAKAPDICLVDWHAAAQPAATLRMVTDSAVLAFVNKGILPGKAEMVMDVAAIRPQAAAIGELVGFKIARALRRGEGNDGGLDANQPMHFIGHSAGGFVVLHAALVLHELGLSPKNLRVTMLDTPVPVQQHLLEELKYDAIDYYCSSAFTTKLVPLNGFHQNYSRFDIPPPQCANIDLYTGAHSYAHDWFIQSICPKNETYAKGFGRSCFATGQKKPTEN